MYECTYVCIYLYIYVWIYVCRYVCIYVCRYVCMYVTITTGYLKKELIYSVGLYKMRSVDQCLISKFTKQKFYPQVAKIYGSENYNFDANVLFLFPKPTEGSTVRRFVFNWDWDCTVSPGLDWTGLTSSAIVYDIYILQ